MRLKAEVWVHAMLRRAFAEGRYGAVLRKGAAEAGVVYVVINKLDGTIRVLGPPPGSAIDESGERRFAEMPNIATMEELNGFIARLARIDPDFWVLEIEDRAGTAGIAVLPE